MKYIHNKYIHRYIYNFKLVKKQKSRKYINIFAHFVQIENSKVRLTFGGNGCWLTVWQSFGAFSQTAHILTDFTLR